jgi:hypothetical protein
MISEIWKETFFRWVGLETDRVTFRVTVRFTVRVTAYDIRNMRSKDYVFYSITLMVIIRSTSLYSDGDIDKDTFKRR